MWFSPKEPPPPEPEWSEQVTDVIHLTNDTFKAILKKKKTALVFFYAPCKTFKWMNENIDKCFYSGCGHCKRAKPLFTNAAAALKDNPKVDDDDRDFFSWTGKDIGLDCTLCCGLYASSIIVQRIWNSRLSNNKIF